MHIRVLFFTVLRLQMQRDQLQMELPAASTVATAIARLKVDHPAIACTLDRSRVAVNADYADPTALLHEGDDLAIIPPVSGG